jgi:hypothetical protein
MRFWTTSLLIFNSLCDNATPSIRHLARQTGIAKSRVPRLKQAMARRDRHPASWLWETEDGRRWLTRLVVAALDTFGLMRGVGLETISAFFTPLRLETQRGCAPSALGRVRQALETAMLATTEAWEHDGVAAGDRRESIGAVDATCWQRMRLVCIDLVSGSLVFAEVAEDRSYDPWHALVKARIEVLGGDVLSLVSDRAKARIKLAETGLEGLSMPEVFHLIHELVKSYALAIGSRLRQARQALQQAEEQRSGAEDQQAQAVVEARAAAVTHWETGQSASRHPLESVSLTVHPWRVCDSTRQRAADVERQ